MFAILRAFGIFVADLLKSRCRLEAENLFLRHQLNIALRRVPPRLRLRSSDRALLIWITKRTHKALGFPVNLHRFRRAAATLWSNRDPANVRGAKDLLGHASFDTTEKY